MREELRRHPLSALRERCTLVRNGAISEGSFRAPLALGRCAKEEGEFEVLSRRSGRDRRVVQPRLEAAARTGAAAVVEDLAALCANDTHC